jgi:ornithine cyclodeaminase
MSARFPIHTIDDLLTLLNRRSIIAAVRDAMIRHSRGEVQSPMPGQLVFDEVHGDCHIKFGHMIGSPNFTVKVATGFYDNVALGLPSANGLSLLFDAQTGAPVCLFQDGGMMTAWRTSAATALAAHCLSPVSAPLIGIVGTGLQAQLSPAWISELLPEARYVMHGRDVARTVQAAAACGATAAPSLDGLLATADIVITATPSPEPLFHVDQTRPGMHFVALGADGPEKQELPTELFARADHILTDDHAQCLRMSEFGKAVVAGQVSPDADVALGSVLSEDAVLVRQPGDISIVDLTGLAAQDIAIANWFGSRLSGQ